MRYALYRVKVFGMLQVCGKSRIFVIQKMNIYLLIHLPHRRYR